MPYRNARLVSAQGGAAMLKQAIVAMLLAATGLTSAPTRAEDDQHLTGLTTAAPS
jgi:hypothetical protein